jgi:putative peptide zinc metalloprotease protein
MTDSLFSPLWYRVANIKPQLKSHVKLHRHDYRGLIWYIFADKASSRNHRFSAKAYQLIGLMNGNRSIDQIWNKVSDQLGDYAPTQSEVIELLGQLHTADLLQTDISADTQELFQRQTQQKTQKLKQKLHSPLAQKFALWDPDSFLQRHLPKVRWLYNWPVVILGLAIIVSGTMTAAMHWQELTSNVIANSLSPYNLIMMVLLYPVIKLLHEFGHAFTTKMEGGEVHEMGIMFLVFMPIPYVNVSSASTFRSKYRRILVGVAGIAVELFLSALALFLWLSVEPGIIKDIAFNILLIGGVSSLFFNGNPLLKYDGYYILADAISIPNLYQRSLRYLAYLCQKYLFGIKNLTSPANAPGEAGWFIVYSISSFIYRTALLWVIILMITEKFFIIGVLLALWLVFSQLILPVFKGIRFIISSPYLQQQRSRAIGVSSISLVFLAIIFGIVPLPSYTRSEGIIWLPEEAQIRAETDGFAGSLQAKSTSYISENSPIVEIVTASLDTEVEVLKAKLTELKTKFRSEWSKNQVLAAIIKGEIKAVNAELNHASQKQQAMLVKSKKNGTLIIPEANDVPGKYIHKGELIGYVLDDSLPTVRAVVTQDNIGQVRKHIAAVEIRLVNQLSQIIPAKITRIAPKATNYLPSAALASTGGGKIAVIANHPDEPKAREKVFHVDLEFPAQQQALPIGARVYVRFDHGSEPLATQWYRSIRQVFLRQFSV